MMKKPSLYSVIGTPVAHSISPAMHNKAFNLLNLNAYYIPVDTAGRELSEIIDSFKTLEFSGWNVTMPHKTEMAKLCDKLSAEAQIIGAVNTVVNKDNILTGYSTDGIGFFRNLKEHGFESTGKKITLLGAGGAARSIAARALSEGVGELVIYNRTLEKARELVRTLNTFEHDLLLTAKSLEDKALKEDVESSDLIVNATSVGMADNSLIIDKNWLKKPTTVAEIIYKPLETPLLKAARERGLQTVDGLGMLLWQGAYSFKYWTGLNFPVEAVRESVFS